MPTYSLYHDILKPSPADLLPIPSPTSGGAGRVRMGNCPEVAPVPGLSWAAAGSQWRERVSGPGSLSRLGCSWHLGIECRAPSFSAFETSFALKCLAVNKRCSSDNTAVLQSERSLPLHLSSATHAVSVLIPAPKGTCNYKPPLVPSRSHSLV